MKQEVLHLTERSTAPPDPAAGRVTIYADADGALHVLESDGTDTEIGAGGGGGIPESIIEAKGDLIVGTAADTAGRLAVDADGKYLRAKSSEGTGLEWGALPSSSTTTPGIVELATDAETIAGTDTTRAVTPASLAARIALLAVAFASVDGVEATPAEFGIASLGDYASAAA